jgi:hypothetical protein
MSASFGTNPARIVMIVPAVMASAMMESLPKLVLRTVAFVATVYARVLLKIRPIVWMTVLSAATASAAFSLNASRVYARRIALTFSAHANDG